MEDYSISSFYSISDVIGLHSYDLVKDINFKHRYNQVKKYWKRYEKPLMFEEMGPDKIAINCCTNIEFHNSVWSTSMMGGFGTGMDWWWDGGVFDFGYQIDLLRIKNFFNGENLRDGKFAPQKWDDVWLGNSNFQMKNRKIENFALISNNKERALGWVHNATYYWRNLEEELPCIENLVNDEYYLNSSCTVAHDPYGYPENYANSIWDFCSPREYHAMYNPEVESLTDFDHSDYKDNYTNIGGTQGLDSWSTFKIKNLKASKGLIKKRWYRIDFYHTHSGIMQPAGFNQTIHTDIFGTLNPQAPVIMWNTTNSADFAYKVTYLGHYKSAISIDEDTLSNESMPSDEDINISSNDFLIIYPNPNNGEFHITCNETIQSIIIYSSKGEKILDISDVNENKYDVKLVLKSGTYLVHVLTKSNSIVNKQIIVL